MEQTLTHYTGTDYKVSVAEPLRCLDEGILGSCELQVSFVEDSDWIRSWCGRNDRASIGSGGSGVNTYYTAEPSKDRLHGD